MSFRPLFHWLPFAVLAAIVATAPPERSLDRPEPPPREASGERLVIVVVDSLRAATLDAPGIMPHLVALSQRAQRLPVHTCSGNFTLPCLRTLLEGKESPFSAGLHNFTGSGGPEDSLVGIAQRAGLESAILSDHTLTSLYGRFASTSVDLSAEGDDALAKDHVAIAKAREVLADRRHRLVLLHVVGTDRVAHSHHPGSEIYEAHYRDVDAALLPLWEMLDLDGKDSLVVTGDHGHDENGHHTRQSVVLFAGKRYDDLFGALAETVEAPEQRDLLYLLLYPLDLTLPAHYEGRFWLTRSNALPAGAEFEGRQSETLRAQGYSASSLAGQIEQLRDKLERRPWGEFLMNLPLLAAFLIYLLVFPSLATQRRRLAWWAAIALAAAGLAATRSPQVGAVLGPLLLLGGLAVALRSRRSLVFALCLACGALTATFAKEWAGFFHTRGGFVPAQPIFLLLLPALGWIARDREAEPRRAWLAGTLTAAWFILPSGVYYYQAGQNFLMPFLGLWALLSLSTLAKAEGRRALAATIRQKWPLLLVAAGCVAVAYLQEGSAWMWLSYVSNFLDRLPALASAALYVLAGLALARTLDSQPKRWIFLGLWAFGWAYAVGFAAMPAATFATAAAMAVAPCAVVALSRGEELVAPALHPDGLGLLFAAGTTAALWYQMHGFFVNNLDFTFAFQYFTWIRQESALFSAISALALIKYGALAGAGAVWLRFHLGAAATERLFDSALLFLLAKLLVLLVQINTGALWTTEKLYELSIMDLTFVGVVTIALLLMYALLCFGERAGRRLRLRFATR